MYFQVHQPKRLQPFRFFDIGTNRDYFDDDLDKEIIQRIAQDCYLPTNALLLKLIKHNPTIKVAFSISGVTIDQLEAYAPEVLDSFRKLSQTGCVDFLTETYYHSLACLMPGNEFELQVAKHQKKVHDHFGVMSTVFRNTELIHSDDVGKRVRDLGFKGVFIDGADRLLGGQSPHHVFHHAGVDDLKLLVRDYRLGDEIAFRFEQFGRQSNASRYIDWLRAIPSDERTICIAMDYETFGEHQKRDTNIFRFLEDMLKRLATDPGFRFVLPGDAVETTRATKPLAIPGYISWADEARDVSAWLGNDMQRDAFDTLVKLEHDVKSLYDKSILEQWRSLQTSDHFYYMATKKGSDGEVHSYFSHYPSPYEAFINFMNVLTDLSLRIKISKAARPVTPLPEDLLSGTALQPAIGY